MSPAIRRNEVVNVLKEGLQDLSISRPKKALGWGIPLPFDADSVVWVWFDALTNYISAIGYGQDPAAFAKRWPADVHIIGKDITRFHCIVWPAMLMAAGIELPKQVFGHGWVAFGGERMSKSMGNVVEPLDAVAKHGPDPLRLYLVREMAYGADGDFTWQRFEERYNADLANNYGNLVSRVCQMALKFREGALAAPNDVAPSRLKDEATRALAEYRTAMDALALQDGAAAAFRLIDAANLFIQESAPWELAKDPAKAGALDRVLFDSAESVRIATILLSPIMPRSAVTVLAKLGASAHASLNDAAWGAAGTLHATVGDPLFPRLQDPDAKKPPKPPKK